MRIFWKHVRHISQIYPTLLLGWYERNLLPISILCSYANYYKIISISFTYLNSQTKLTTFWSLSLPSSLHLERHFVLLVICHFFTDNIVTFLNLSVLAISFSVNNLTLYCSLCKIRQNNGFSKICDILERLRWRE